MNWSPISLLSMGALFGIFAGIYFWLSLITGLQYNEARGQLHFITFFIGVNMTFFPMHMLGLSGMPRRYYDYPDAYIGWNSLITYGSIISFISTLLLAGPISFVPINQYVHPTNSSSLDWILPATPAHHTFNIVPVLRS
jgi:heme/copper-type cytochrome/quinol oxidase subunit 1